MKKSKNNRLNSFGMSRGMKVLIFIFSAVTMLSCASKLGPGGGPYDDAPPVLLKSVPASGALNVNTKKFIFYFDEYITVKDASKKVIISPPQQQNPKIQAIGKRVEVILEDSLISNTTYTIDFTNSIEDNNERNALENFSHAFSTGNEIDTMEIAGVVLNARDLEPVSDVVVGIHADPRREAFRDTTFLRMSRTSDRARFVIRNMKSGSYSLFALKDNDNNYRYNSPMEAVAFFPERITTSSEPAVRQDTIFKTVKGKPVVDSTYLVKYTRYLPDDVVLRFFQSDKQRNYIVKRERRDSATIELEFNLPFLEEKDIPSIRALGLESAGTDPRTKIFTDADLYTKKATYLLTDSLYHSRDTFIVNYPSIDSLNNIIVVSDTIALRTPPKKQVKEKKEDADTPKDSTAVEKPKPTWTLSMETKGDGGISDSILISSTYPVDTEMLRKALRLVYKKDTIEVDAKIDTLMPMPGRSRLWLLKAPLSYKQSYTLYADSASVNDILGRPLLEPLKKSFETKAKSEFSSLLVEVLGYGQTPMIGELLNESDKILGVAYSNKNLGEIVFSDLKPGNYYLRVIIDRNGNGRWDPGDYDKNLQPEEVFYLNKKMELLKNWTVKENFDPKSIPLDKQKPLELVRNKPKEVEKRDKNKEREEEMKRRRSGMGSSGGGFDLGGGMGGLRQSF
ncbi:Ig-like domain-containing protein [Porphyromonas canoris]|nr:Ig-like domain-containing protein [Porphyromonas canoris]